MKIRNCNCANSIGNPKAILTMCRPKHDRITEYRSFKQVQHIVSEITSALSVAIFFYRGRRALAPALTPGILHWRLRQLPASYKTPGISSSFTFAKKTPRSRFPTRLQFFIKFEFISQIYVLQYCFLNFAKHLEIRKNL